MNCSRILALLSFLSLATTAAAAVAPATQPSTRPATGPDGKFVVFGRVTDPSGKPLDGVTIQARSGVATLYPAGATRTGRDGRYRLHVDPAVYVERRLRERSVGLQPATIRPSKKGLFEQNLHRQGDLAITDDPHPEPEETRHYAGIVRPYQPYELHFVMDRAAIVDGRLADPAGNPLPGRTIYLTGPKLPPSSSVVASDKTDPNGRFQFTTVPTHYEWSFSLPDRGEDVVGKPFTVEGPSATPVRFDVVLDSDRRTVTTTPSKPPQSADRR